MFERVEVVANDVKVFRVFVFWLAIMVKVWDDDGFSFGGGEVLGIGFAEEL